VGVASEFSGNDLLRTLVVSEASILPLPLIR
jgi:hypothetical protein